MNKGLESVIEAITDNDDNINGGLSRFDNSARKVVFPATLGGIFLLESLNLADSARSFILSNAQNIIDQTGEVGYKLVEYLTPYLTAGTCAGLVAIPAVIALGKYHQDMQKSKFTPSSKQPIKTILNNSAINNKFVLPALTAASSADLAYSYLDKTSLYGLAQGLLFAGVGLVASKDIHRYFKNMIPEIPEKGRIKSKMPLVHILCAAAVLGAAGGKINYETADQQNQSVTSEYLQGIEDYSIAFGENPDFARGLTIVDPSISDPMLLGPEERTVLFVKRLNSLIDGGELKGIERFDIEDVVNSDSENARATVATIKSLRGICDDFQQRDEENCLEIMAAAYLTGNKTIIEALESGNTNNFWKAAEHIKPDIRKRVVNYVEKVMAYYWVFKNGIVWPTDCTDINSKFAVHRSNYLHRGIDIAPTNPGVPGNNIYSIADGIIVKINRNKSKREGIYIKIQHGNPGRIYSWYMHGNPGSIMVREGQRVKKGEQIMRMGATGNATGVHLHFATTTEYPIFGGINPHYIDPSDFYNLNERSGLLMLQR